MNGRVLWIFHRRSNSANEGTQGSIKVRARNWRGFPSLDLQSGQSPVNQTLSVVLGGGQSSRFFLRRLYTTIDHESRQSPINQPLKCCSLGGVNHPKNFLRRLYPNLHKIKLFFWISSQFWNVFEAAISQSSSEKTNTFKLYYVLLLIEQRRFESIYFHPILKIHFLSVRSKTLSIYFRMRCCVHQHKSKTVDNKRTTQVGCLTKGHGANWTSRPKTG